MGKKIEEIIVNKQTGKYAIFGAGEKGQYLFQILREKKIEIDTWVDSNYKKKGKLFGCKIESPSLLNNNYDLIFLAVGNENAKDEMEKYLEEQGVEHQKIIWIEDLKIEKNDMYILCKGFFMSSFVRRVIFDAILNNRMWSKVGQKQFIRQIEKVVLWGGKIDEISWFTDEEKGIAYFRNAKVACSSFIAVIKNWTVKSNTTVHKDLENEEIRGELSNADNYFKFTFVRNPFSRLYSCYMNKVSDVKNPIFDTYCLGYLKEDKGFKNFVKKVCLIPDVWADRHFSSQCYQLYQDGDLVCDYVGKIEELPEAFKDITEKYKLKDLPRLNPSNTHNWKDCYDLEMVEMVYNRYKKDFEYFGYYDCYEELKLYVKEKENGD